MLLSASVNIFYAWVCCVDSCGVSGHHWFYLLAAAWSCEPEQHFDWSSSSSSSQIFAAFFSCERLRMYAFSGRFFSSLQNGHESFFGRAISFARCNFSVKQKWKHSISQFDFGESTATKSFETTSKLINIIPPFVELNRLWDPYFN